MSDGNLKLHIVTPTSQLLSTQVDEVVIPARNGQMGILPGHTPILTFLGAGPLAYIKGGQAHILALEGGFAEVNNDEVNVLTEKALKISEIDREEAERELAEAQKTLLEKELNEEEFEREQIKLAIARTKKELSEK